MADLSIIIVVSMFLISALVGIIMFFWKESTLGAGNHGTVKGGSIKLVASVKPKRNDPSKQNFTNPKNSDEAALFKGTLKTITLGNGHNEWRYSNTVGGGNVGVVTIDRSTKGGCERITMTQQQYKALQEQSKKTHEDRNEAIRQRTTRNIAREAAAAEKRAKSKPSRRSEERRARH